MDWIKGCCMFIVLGGIIRELSFISLNEFRQSHTSKKNSSGYANHHFYQDNNITKDESPVITILIDDLMIP